MRRYVVVSGTPFIGVETRQDALERAKAQLKGTTKKAYIFELVEVVEIAEPPIVQREPMEGDLQ